MSFDGGVFSLGDGYYLNKFDDAHVKLFRTDNGQGNGKEIEQVLIPVDSLRVLAEGFLGGTFVSGDGEEVVAVITEEAAAPAKGKPKGKK